MCTNCLDYKCLSQNITLDTAAFMLHAWGVLGSNLCLKTRYHDRLVRSLPHLLQADATPVPLITPKPLPSTRYWLPSQQAGVVAVLKFHVWEMHSLNPGQATAYPHWVLNSFPHCLKSNAKVYLDWATSTSLQILSNSHAPIILPPMPKSLKHCSTVQYTNYQSKLLTVLPNTHVPICMYVYVSMEKLQLSLHLL
jgi:hypothetical protein